MPEINAWSPETGFQHKPPGHNKKHLHWAIFIAVVLAAAALAVIYVEKFKTEEDIDSLHVLPEVGKKQTNSNFDQSRLDFNEFEDGEIAPIATTRPELIPACVALYTNSKDPRYANTSARKRALL